MKKLLAFGLLSFATTAFAQNTMTMYKSSTCGCCDTWQAIMEKNGYKMNTTVTNEMHKVKMKAGLTPDLASCHTAFLNGYLIEGHVSLTALEKLLSEKPDIKGLVVPRMPIGSTGMEYYGQKEKYDILALHHDGSTSIFEAH